MVWERIRGHKAQVEMFRRSIGRGRFAHAYLFVGPAGVGKRKFAAALAQCLLCERIENSQLDACGTCPACRQTQAGTHPDLISIGCPAGKSELPIELFVGVRERRGREGLCHDLSMRPSSSEYKIAVIDDADRMNQESANALLKTLEEPPSYARLVLVAANEDAILPTIRSRCQLIRFAALPPADVCALLLELELADGKEEAERVAELSGGSLTLARQLLDPQLRALREALYDLLARDPFDAAAAAAAMTAGVEEIGGETSAKRQSAIWIVRFTVQFYRSAVHALSGSPTGASIRQVQSFASRLNAGTHEHLEMLLACLERALSSERQLDRNLSIPLCLESLFQDLGRLLRGSTGVPAGVK